MHRTVLWSLALVLFFACSDDGNQNQNGDSESDTSSDPTDGGSGENDGTETGDEDSLWAAAWSIFSTRCGTAGACHNRSSGGPGGLSLPSDDESTSKANAEALKDDIHTEISSGGMPKDSTLSTEDRAKITDWIDSL
jgi:hypothetical protein